MSFSLSFSNLVGEERAQVFQYNHDQIFNELRKVIEYSLNNHNDTNHFKFLDKLDWLLKQSNIAEYDADVASRYKKTMDVARAPLEQFVGPKTHTPPGFAIAGNTIPEPAIVAETSPELTIPTDTPPDQNELDDFATLCPMMDFPVDPDLGVAACTPLDPPTTTFAHSEIAATVSTPETLTTTSSVDQSTILAESKRKVAAARASGRFDEMTGVSKAAKRSRSNKAANIPPLTTNRAVMCFNRISSTWKLIIEIDGQPKDFPLLPGTVRLPDGTISIPRCGIFTLDQLVQVFLKKYRAVQAQKLRDALFLSQEQMTVAGTDPTLTSFNFGATGTNMSYNFNAPPVDQPAPVFTYSAPPPAALPVAQQATFYPSQFGGPNVQISSLNPQTLNQARRARALTNSGLVATSSNPTLA